MHYIYVTQCTVRFFECMEICVIVMRENMIDNEVPKHRKKKKSSVSKSGTKSNHKHEYRECLLIHDTHPHRAAYCKICGKIGDIHFFECEKREDGLYRQLDYDEVFEKYKDLEKIYIDDIWQKYVPINSEGGDQS